jgi:hypothetical protein
MQHGGGQRKTDDAQQKQSEARRQPLIQILMGNALAHDVLQANHHRRINGHHRAEITIYGRVMARPSVRNNADDSSRLTENG